MVKQFHNRRDDARAWHNARNSLFPTVKKRTRFKADALFFKIIWYFGLWTGFKRKCVEQKNTANPLMDCGISRKRMYFCIVRRMARPRPCHAHGIPFPGTHGTQLWHSPDSLSMGEIIKYAKVETV
ncbi:hypothetical protein D7X25_21625 [bacterium 1XD42-8]|nr:hypothetical protein D7X25_21625 [bacterium 1XD42-8]